MSCYRDRRVDFRHPEEGETQVNLTENCFKPANLLARSSERKRLKIS